MSIPSPTNLPGDTNRAFECEEILHPVISGIVAEATDVGWTADELLVAIEEVVKALRSPATNPADPEPTNDWPAAI